MKDKLNSIIVRYQNSPFYAGVCGEVYCSCPIASSEEELRQNMLRMIRQNIQVNYQRCLDGKVPMMPATRARIEMLFRNLPRLEDLVRFIKVPSFLAAC